MCINCVRAHKASEKLLEEVKEFVNTELKNGWKPPFGFSKSETPGFYISSQDIKRKLYEFKDIQDKKDLLMSMLEVEPFQLRIGKDNQVV